MLRTLRRVSEMKDRIVCGDESARCRAKCWRVRELDNYWRSELLVVIYCYLALLARVSLDRGRRVGDPHLHAPASRSAVCVSRPRAGACFQRHPPTPVPAGARPRAPPPACRGRGAGVGA